MPWCDGGDSPPIWYRDEGEGTPLILLHGWCMSSRIWEFQYQGLSSRLRLIAPDLRGHGGSPAGGREVTLELLVDDMECLFASLHLTQPAVLVGWSMGALVAIHAFSRVRQNIAGLLLMNATPCFVSRQDFPHGRPLSEVQGMERKIRKHGVGQVISGFKAGLFSEVEKTCGLITSHIQNLLDEIAVPSTDVALQGLQVLRNSDVREILSQLDCPTVVISGEDDTICLHAASVYVAQQVAGCRLSIIPGAGHAPFLTHNDLINGMVLEFVRGLGETDRY